MSTSNANAPRLAALQKEDALPERNHTPTNAELFLYNAVLWNAHRIHYDLPYAQNEEGYEGLVIAGPQIGDWMIQVIDNLMADAADGEEFMLASLDYSNRSAAYIGETLLTGGTVTEVVLDNAEPPQVQQVDVELFVKNQRGDVITPGTAVLKRIAAS